MFLITLFWTFSLTSYQPNLAQPKTLFELYAQNRRENIPNFITSDFIVQSYALLLAEERIRIEESVLKPKLENLIGHLSEKIEIQQDDILAKYITTLECLISGETQAKDASVRQELELIHAAQGIATSPILIQRLDYNRFQIRGHYAEEESLSHYFRAFTYASSALFYTQSSPQTGISHEIAEQLGKAGDRLIKVIRKDERLYTDYLTIAKTLEFWYGEQDGPWLDDMPQYQDDWALYQDKVLQELRCRKALPNIATVPMVISPFEKIDLNALTGFRLISQRAMADTIALNKLVYPNVGLYRGNLPAKTNTIAGAFRVKGFPRALELMSLLGSSQALTKLVKANDHNYDDYQKATFQAQEALQKAKGIRKHNLEITEILAKTNLQTALSFWTRCRHSELLYATPSYTMVSKSIFLRPRTFASLEKHPRLYGKILDTVTHMQKQSSSLELQKFKELMNQILHLSHKSDPYIEEDYQFLNNLDLLMNHCVAQEDLPVIVDIHTDLNSYQVLQQGTGYPKLVEDKATDGHSRGGRLTHFEEIFPMEKRLNDRQWRAQLNINKGIELIARQ